MASPQNTKILQLDDISNLMAQLRLRRDDTHTLQASTTNHYLDLITTQLREHETLTLQEWRTLFESAEHPLKYYLDTDVPPESRALIEDHISTIGRRIDAIGNACFAPHRIMRSAWIAQLVTELKTIAPPKNKGLEREYVDAYITLAVRALGRCETLSTEEWETVRMDLASDARAHLSLLPRALAEQAEPAFEWAEQAVESMVTRQLEQPPLTFIHGAGEQLSSYYFPPQRHLAKAGIHRLIADLEQLKPALGTPYAKILRSYLDHMIRPLQDEQWMPEKRYTDIILDAAQEIYEHYPFETMSEAEQEQQCNSSAICPSRHPISGNDISQPHPKTKAADNPYAFFASTRGRVTPVCPIYFPLRSP